MLFQQVVKSFSNKYLVYWHLRLFEVLSYLNKFLFIVFLSLQLDPTMATVVPVKTQIQVSLQQHPFFPKVYICFHSFIIVDQYYSFVSELPTVFSLLGLVFKRLNYYVAYFKFPTIVCEKFVYYTG